MYMNYFTCPAVKCLSCLNEMIAYRLVSSRALNWVSCPHENVSSYPTEIKSMLLLFYILALFIFFNFWFAQLKE